MSLFGFNFKFLKDEAESFKENERLRKLEENVQKKRNFDSFLENVEGKKINYTNNSKTIVVLDDSQTMIVSIERDFKRLQQISNFVNGKDEDKRNWEKLQEEIRRHYPSKEQTFKDFLKSYKPEDFCITYFETERCGFEFLKSLEDFEQKLDYAILDITFGGLMFDKNNKIVSLDGIDVAVKIRERFPDCGILFNTGYDLSEPENTRTQKLKNLCEKIGDFRYTIKGVNPYERLCAIIELISQ